MALVAVANVKGGQGKSTWSAILKSHLNGSGLVLDLDPQQGDAHTWAQAAGVDSKLIWPETLFEDLEAAANDNLWWHVADCPPNEGEATRAALALAAIVFVPLIPGGAQDAQAWGRMSDLLEEAWKVNPDMEAVVLLNSVRPTALSRDFQELLQSWHSPEDGRNFIGSVPMHVAIAETIAKGKAPADPAVRKALKGFDKVVKIASSVTLAKAFINTRLQKKAGDANE